MKYEVYLTDAEYDTVKINANSYKIENGCLSFYRSNQPYSDRIACFNFGNIKGFMEVNE